jgi:hypothetical protein
MFCPLIVFENRLLIVLRIAIVAQSTLGLTAKTKDVRSNPLISTVNE